MKELFRCMKAEGLKMRHTFLYPMYLGVPVLGSLVFLLYYGMSGRGGIAWIFGYLEVIGFALPFVVSILCAGSVGMEERNHFQPFLGGCICKGNAFLAKLLMLSGLGICAVVMAVFLFAAGYRLLPGREGISFGGYGCLAAVLCLGSVPLYLEHLFWNLTFSKTVSLCMGVAEFLLSALFLTGLGEGRWFFFPCSWSARGAALFLTYVTGEEKAALAAEMGRSSVICLLLFFLICALIGIWFYFYEGRQCND